MFLILNNKLQAHRDKLRDDNLFFPMMFHARNIQDVPKFNVQILQVETRLKYHMIESL